MKKSLLFLALGLSIAMNTAYADTYDATISGDGYQFSNSFSGTTNFDDYIFFSTEGTQNIVASVSGTGGSAFSFKEFNLLDSDKNFIASGSVFNSTARISFGGLESDQLTGSFYLQVVGSSVGATAGYNGTIITTAVTEPESFALMLAGISIIGAIGRRKLRKQLPSLSY
jgi:hypothetical protein